MLVHQEAGEEGGDAGERVLSRGGVSTLDRDNAGTGAVLRILTDRRVGPVKPVISAGVDLHLDPGTARSGAVEQLLARRRRGPDVLGAEQGKERDGARPILLLSAVVA